MSVPNFKKQMQLGLGEAISRLMRLEKRTTANLATPEEKAERELLFEALNETKLDLGFDCDLDGVPDTVAIFAKTAKTSCCRLLPHDGKRRRDTSRRRKR